MEIIYPKILVVTEEPLRDNSFGFGRTLTNVFKNYPTNYIQFYIADYPYTHPDYFTKFVVIKRNLFNLNCSHRRWYANPINIFFNFINYSLQYLRPNYLNIEKINEFSPDIVLTVPMNYTTFLEGYLVSKKISKPLFIYMMDDIFYKNYFHFGALFSDLVKTVFVKSAAWIMISKYLTDEFKVRYNIVEKSNFILHNPIDLNLIIQEFVPIQREEFIVAYAGSIHGFHFDPILKVAKAIFSLQEKGIKVSLIVYTNSIYWDFYKIIFKKLGVINGGSIKYEQLFTTLNQADILLCSSSFDSKHKRLISTSVFTKITDYMASARPVWAYGSNYAANNKFLNEKKIGYANCFETIDEIENFIVERMNNRLDEVEIVGKQTKFIVNEYDEIKVNKNLLTFISDIIN